MLSSTRLCLLSFAIPLLAVGCSCSTPSDPDDAGTDAPTVDGGGVDGGAFDGGGVDASTLDGAMNDAALRDTSPPDAPRADAGMCMDLPADPTRPVAIQCSPCRPPGTGGGGSKSVCDTDADCTAGNNGRCVFGRGGPYCDYDACFVDGDCENDELCLCDGASSGTGGGNVCISAECRVDADCPGDFACSPTLGSCGHYSNFRAYRCHRAADACTTDSDCALGYCAFDEPSGHWACSTDECAG